MLPCPKNKWRKWREQERMGIRESGWSQPFWVWLLLVLSFICILGIAAHNCLIPPPSGYKIPMKWPKSRDQVWKANIPHTHLATEKSDQNWMVVKGEKIVFPGGGTHFHYGADKYIASIANLRGGCNHGK
ncbi:hypothetical protein RIF29_24088 [Crotalaria pallida]|uniref:Methyltransferase n=1 Tax=Crotalaria pallida TaxID=3830 RepID=A0AAN9EJ57_CROPI